MQVQNKSSFVRNGMTGDARSFAIRFPAFCFPKTIGPVDHYLLAVKAIDQRWNFNGCIFGKYDDVDSDPDYWFLQGRIDDQDAFVTKLKEVLRLRQSMQAIGLRNAVKNTAGLQVKILQCLVMSYHAVAAEKEPAARYKIDGLAPGNIVHDELLLLRRAIKRI